MIDAKVQWEPTGLERFGHLEDKLYRLVEGFKAVRKENETLRADNEKLKSELEAVRQSESSQIQRLENLQKEREELRERVEKALGLLATLDVG
jgi:FtsZ-binding cell division protein ZapB